jgi:hypothetical protein
MSRRLLAPAGVAAFALLYVAGPARAQDTAESGVAAQHPGGPVAAMVVR